MPVLFDGLHPAAGTALRAGAGVRTGQITRSWNEEWLLVICPVLTSATPAYRPECRQRAQPLIFSVKWPAREKQTDVEACPAKS